MSKIKGIYAAGLSILNADLSLNIEKTILHSEKIIDDEIILLKRYLRKFKYNYLKYFYQMF